MNQKVLVLFSGGIDSTVLLVDMIDKGYEPEALFINHGQKAYSREHTAMRYITAHYGRIWLVRTFEDTSEERVEGVVKPFRNGIFLSLATAMAVHRDMSYVAIGVQSGDNSPFPDCRPGFITAMKEVISFGTEGDVQLLAPFLEHSKAEVIERGIELKVPFELTYSCYEGGEKHCGTCLACEMRKRAFKEAQVEDPAEYTVIET